MLLKHLYLSSRIFFIDIIHINYISVGYFWDKSDLYWEKVGTSLLKRRRKWYLLKKDSDERNIIETVIKKKY